MEPPVSAAPTERPAKRRRRPGRLRGLKAQIVLWTVLPLTLVLIGVAFTGVYSHERTMRVLVAERDRALVQAAAGQLRDLIERRTLALQTLAGNPALQGSDPGAALTAIEAAEGGAGLFADGLLLVDAAGGIAAPAGAPGLSPESLAAIGGLGREVITGEQAAARLSRPSGVAGAIVLVGVPVRARDSRVIAALVGADPLVALDLDRLLGEVQVSEHGAAYLVASDGRVLARAPAGAAEPVAPAGDKAAADGPRATMVEMPGGERMSLAYAPVDGHGLGWSVVVEQPWHEVIGPVLTFSQFMPLVAALAAIVSVLTLYYGVRSIVQPLRALGQQAERVAWGDFSATGTPVGGVSEIEELRETLDQMARRIQGYQSGMHDYIAAMTHGQEEERRRLARELHDDTAQALIALGQRVEMAQRALPAGAGPAGERLSTVRAMIADALESVRRFGRDLRPIYLEDLGFVPALEVLTREVGARPAEAGRRPAVDLSTTGLVRRLPPDLELAAYRIVQEALNNVLRHAQATHAWVEARFDPAALTLVIRDDGQGFVVPPRPESLAREGHFGLMGIQERALLYGGRLAIQSAPGRGTVLTVRLSCPD